MTHLWKQTITIDSKIARKLIETQHHIPVASITLLDEGWDNIVYLVNDVLVFRFPRRELGLGCMENEIALLPYIAKHVTFPLSAPHWIGQPSDVYPFSFSGYSVLPGKPLCDATLSLIDNEAFACVLAAWLKELHEVNIREKDFTALKGDQNWRLNISHRILRCNENLTQYENYFIQAGFNKLQLQQIIEQLSHLKITPFKKAYVHGDLYHRHVIVDPKNLLPTGLIDWGDIHISHPGIDLAVGMIFSDTAFTYFLNAYNRIDDETIAISLLHAFAHGMSFLPYAYDQAKEPLKRWAYLQLTNAINRIIKLDM